MILGATAGNKLGCGELSDDQTRPGQAASAGGEIRVVGVQVQTWRRRPKEEEEKASHR